MLSHVSGQVYESGAGIPVPGAMVSNGERIVRTDDDGRYRLEIDPDGQDGHQFVTLSVPSGFRPAGTFYYRVRDLVNGASAGVAGRAASFPLIRAPERNRSSLTIAHVSDTHVIADEDRQMPEATQAAPLTTGAQANLRWRIFHLESKDPPSHDLLASDLEQIIASAGPDLFVATGDLTNAGTLGSLRAYRDAVESVSVPTYSVFGGHDGNEERAGEHLQEREPPTPYTRHYEAILGPIWYSFDWGPWHFVTYADEEQFFSPSDRERKTRWLQADLAAQAPGRPIVMLVHRPPTSALLDMLRPYDVRLVLNGHTHCSRVRVLDGIPVIEAPPLCFGGIDTRPRGFSLVSLTPDAIKAKLVALPGAAPNGTTPVPVPAAIHRAPAVAETPLAGTDIPQSLALGDGTAARRWHVSVPGGMHRAAAVPWAGALLVSQSDESYPSRSGVTCLDAATGDRRWHTPTDCAIKNSIALTYSPPGWSGISGEPGLSGDLSAVSPVHCYAVSVAGRLYALDTTTGAVLWHADVPRYPHRALRTSPVVVGERVYVTWGSGMVAIERVTGRQLFERAFGHGSERPFSGPTPYRDLLIHPIARWGALALSGGDGSTVWERRFPAESYGASPLLVGDTVVVAGTGGHLARLDATTGATIWQRTDAENDPGTYAVGLTSDATARVASSNRGRATSEAALVFATTSAGDVYCLDSGTGDLVWRFQTGLDLVDATPYRRGRATLLAPPVFLDGRVLVGACDGWLYSLSAEDGRLHARTWFGAPITAAPTLVNGGVCIGTYHGALSYFG